MIQTLYNKFIQIVVTNAHRNRLPRSHKIAEHKTHASVQSHSTIGQACTRAHIHTDWIDQEPAVICMGFDQQTVM